MSSIEGTLKELTELVDNIERNSIRREDFLYLREKVDSMYAMVESVLEAFESEDNKSEYPETKNKDRFDMEYEYIKQNKGE